MHAQSHAGHAHHHSHGHGADAVRRLWIALAITIAILAAELAGGVLSNSLALLADAGHVLTDAAALALSIFVAWFGARPETDRRSYGYLRWEILAAFLNGATLLLISAWIIWEAVVRLHHPQPVQGGLMLGFAAAGLVANLGAAWVLHPASEGSLNMRGAYLHVLGDLLGTASTLAAALVIRYTGWLAADPVASVAVTLLIVVGAWRLVRESVDILLESTPTHISATSVREQLEAIPGVESVHDLHIWSVASGLVAMSAHVICRESERHQHVLEHVHDAMQLFGIQHVTIQLERQEMYEREVHLHA